VKIYISPARHPEGQNLDVNGKSERARMLAVGRKLFDALAAKGFNGLFLNEELDLAGAVNESNIWGADLHIALHSNASRGAQSGMEAWIHQYNLRMDELARRILGELTRATQLPIRRGSKGWAKRSRVDPPWVRPRSSFGLFEVERTKADAILLELYFHDNMHDCAVWEQNEDKAVEAMAEAISQYLRGGRECE
jgi:N-acetylmuramoyl-L-alanine amidase